MCYLPKKAVLPEYSETIASRHLILLAYLPGVSYSRQPAIAPSNGTIGKMTWDYPLDHSNGQANRSAA
jgi:hypothetical protein